MDNITHSLVGITSAEGLYQVWSRKREGPKRLRWALWFIAFVANSFPDLDYFYIALMPFRRLNALLHHRGHTHTLILALPEALLIALGFWALSKWKKWEWTKAEQALLLFTATLGILIHIGLDSLNSYGVHPYWPFDSRWYYGDTIFIVEPWVWITFSPLLLKCADSNWLKALFVSFIIGGLGLSWFSGYVDWEISTLLTCLALFMMWSTHRFAMPQTHAVVWSLFAVLLVTFRFVSLNVRAVAQEAVKKESEGVIVHDVIRSSLPSNPFCWMVISVESLGPIKEYKMRRAIVTPFPKIYSREKCMKNPMMQKLFANGGGYNASDFVHWYGGRELDFQRLNELTDTHCGVRSFLAFSRAPVFEETEERIKVWDMRFELRGRNFTEVEFFRRVPEDDPLCQIGAPWIPPRQDFFNSH